MRSGIRQDIGFDGGVSGQGLEITISVEYGPTPDCARLARQRRNQSGFARFRLDADIGGTAPPHLHSLPASLEDRRLDPARGSRSRVHVRCARPPKAPSEPRHIQQVPHQTTPAVLCKRRSGIVTRRIRTHAERIHHNAWVRRQIHLLPGGRERLNHQKSAQGRRAAYRFRM